MSNDEEDLAIALWVRRYHGSQGCVFIAEQIGAMVVRDDKAGIERWKRIAAAYQQAAQPH